MTPDSTPPTIRLEGTTTLVTDEAGKASVLGMLDQAAGVVMQGDEVQRAIVILLREDRNHAIYHVGLSSGDVYLALESAQMNLMADEGWI